MNNDNGQARGHILLAARQQVKVIFFERPLSMYIKIIIKKLVSEEKAR